jgi:hypothetical protein
MISILGSIFGSIIPELSGMNLLTNLLTLLYVPHFYVGTWYLTHLTVSRISHIVPRVNCTVGIQTVPAICED